MVKNMLGVSCKIFVVTVYGIIMQGLTYWKVKFCAYLAVYFG